MNPTLHSGCLARVISYFPGDPAEVDVPELA